MNDRERFSRQLGAVRCPLCGYSATLMSSDHLTDVWTQLRRFLNVNGCIECETGELVLTEVAFVDLRSPTGALN